MLICADLSEVAKKRIFGLANTRESEKCKAKHSLPDFTGDKRTKGWIGQIPLLMEIPAAFSRRYNYLPRIYKAESSSLLSHLIAAHVRKGYVVSVAPYTTVT